MFIEGMENNKDIIFKANKFFETLSENLCTKEEKLNWFKELMSHVGSVLNKLRELQSDGTIRDHEFALVYLRQLMTTLSFLVKVFVKEIETQQTFLEARFFILNQIQLCMKGFQDDLLEVKEPNEGNLLGSFIKLVDYSLDKISDIYDSKLNANEVLNICSEAKIIFSELLTHAMVISQISLELDSKMIEGSCKSVIDSLEWIVKEIGKQNQAMINLSVQACSDKICILERRVNNGVLKLTLKVFTEYTELLDKINSYCFDFSNSEKPLGEFASLVEKHDFQVDRILQIGLFAVSCSTDKMNAVKIRSCLAILESLETELIPSFATVLRKQTKQSMNLAILFKELWIGQVALLESFVFKIIDPYAFCQLVYDENKEILGEYCTNLNRAGGPSKINYESERIFENVEAVKKVLANAKLLLAVTETVKEEYTECDFRKAYQDFKNVFNEVKWAYILLKQNKDASNHAKSWKRCKVLQTTISTLAQHFLKEESDEYDTSVLSKEPFCENQNEERDPVTENAFLQHIINRGRDILKDRSNLHINSEMDTSLKNIKEITNKKIKEIQRDKKKVPLSKYVHLRKISFMNSSLVSNNSNIGKESEGDTSATTTSSGPIAYGKLEFSDIIMELNNLTQTFFDLTRD